MRTQLQIPQTKRPLQRNPFPHLRTTTNPRLRSKRQKNRRPKSLRVGLSWHAPTTTRRLLPFPRQARNKLLKHALGSSTPI
jgi:hypothetical protein